jgi:hypothetical protein
MQPILVVGGWLELKETTGKGNGLSYIFTVPQISTTFILYATLPMCMVFSRTSMQDSTTWTYISFAQIYE